MTRNIITGIDVGTYHVKVVIVDARERNEKGFKITPPLTGSKKII
jgi:sugar (pentulose or hexulose) kinase